jgi:hypothetical protein
MVNTQAVIAFITAAFPTAKRYWRHEGWCVSPQGEKEQNHKSTNVTFLLNEREGCGVRLYGDEHRCRQEQFLQCEYSDAGIGPDVMSDVCCVPYGDEDESLWFYCTEVVFPVGITHKEIVRGEDSEFGTYTWFNSPVFKDAYKILMDKARTVLGDRYDGWDTHAFNFGLKGEQLVAIDMGALETYS